MHIHNIITNIVTINCNLMTAAAYTYSINSAKFIILKKFPWKWQQPKLVQKFQNSSYRLLPLILRPIYIYIYIYIYILLIYIIYITYISNIYVWYIQYIIYLIYTLYVLYNIYNIYIYIYNICNTLHFH